MGHQGPNLPSRTRLFEKGWRQGAVFSVPEGQISCLVNMKATEGVTKKEKVLSRKEKLLLISHDCDIASSASTYPYLEALICKSYDVSTAKGLQKIRQLGATDPRSFVVRSDVGLVAETRYRVLLQKELFEDLPEPEFVISGETEVSRFRAWLAMRYAREAFQERTHELVFHPLNEVVRTIREHEPEYFKLIDAIVHGIRVRIPDEDTQPMNVGLLVVLKDLADNLSDAHLDAVQYLVSLFVEILQSDDAIHFTGLEQVLYEEVRHVDILRTMDLSTDWASYDQDLEISGALPLRLLEQPMS